MCNGGTACAFWFRALAKRLVSSNPDAPQCIGSYQRKGGLLSRPIKLVYYDDQTNAATVPGIYAKLIDVDKVDLLMGHATNLIVAAMPLIVERKKLVMVLLALGSNAEFKYPRYFQSAAFGPDSKGVLSNNFFAVAKSLAPEPRPWPWSAPTPSSPTTC